MSVHPITEENLKTLVDTFYARVRQDDLIGPLFNRAVHDWPQHLESLAAFWSSVMMTTGRYKGSPMAAHIRHRESIRPEMFERWLEIWRETTTELMEPDAAAALQEKASRIAESLSLALFFKL